MGDTQWENYANEMKSSRDQWQDAYYQKHASALRKDIQIEKYEKALREIDNHIRSTPDATPHIIETLKSTLPEYK